MSKVCRIWTSEDFLCKPMGPELLKHFSFNVCKKMAFCCRMITIHFVLPVSLNRLTLNLAIIFWDFSHFRYWIVEHHGKVCYSQVKVTWSWFQLPIFHLVANHCHVHWQILTGYLTVVWQCDVHISLRCFDCNPIQYVDKELFLNYSILSTCLEYIWYISQSWQSKKSSLVCLESVCKYGMD